MLVNNRGDATDLKIFHVSMASNNGATTLTVTDLSIKARQARGDGTGQSDHECMAFRGQYVLGNSWRSREQFALRLHGEIPGRKFEKNRSGWPKANHL